MVEGGGGAKVKAVLPEACRMWGTHFTPVGGRVRTG